MKKPHVVYATRFPGELPVVNRFLGLYGLTAQPVENFLPRMPEFRLRGKRLGSDAWTIALTVAEEIIHADHLRPESFLIIGEMTGVWIHGLGNEPGIHLRHWRSHAEQITPLQEMTDEDIDRYALERMKGMQGAGRQCAFKTALSGAIVPAVPADSTTNGREAAIHRYQGILKGQIREEASDLRIDGVPFASIFATQYGWLLGELCSFEMEFKNKHSLFDHREKALKDLLSDQGMRRFLGLDPLEYEE